jgi:hypothetical protein
LLLLLLWLCWLLLGATTSCAWGCGLQSSRWWLLPCWGITLRKALLLS